MKKVRDFDESWKRDTKERDYLIKKLREMT